MINRKDIKPGLWFRVYNTRIAASGVITKVNRINVLYDAPYFKTTTSPDGWIRGLKVALSDIETGDAIRLHLPELQKVTAVTVKEIR